MQLGGADLRHQRRRGLEVGVQDVQRGRLVIGSSGLIELRRLGSGSNTRKIGVKKIGIPTGQLGSRAIMHKPHTSVINLISALSGLRHKLRLQSF